MHVKKQWKTPKARSLLKTNPAAAQAYDEIEDSIRAMVGFINDSGKNCNGVVPIKEGCYVRLEDHYLWYREKPLEVLEEKGKGGPIDVYKEFPVPGGKFCVGLEFETGNISSAHRSMNKLLLALRAGELQMGVLMMPMHELSYYLTDRVSNYEELEPYFSLVSGYPFVFIGFDAEGYGPGYPLLPKGSDGMSPRSIRKWADRDKKKK